MSSSQRGSGRRAPRPGGATANGSLYERYKDALRRGHVAALRSRNEAAVDAYGEAALIAPDRALPHASIAGILVKMGRLDEAVAAYERALALAPRDEAALRGLADIHVRAGHRTAAAAILDRLADSLDGAGRLADATDAARRALELAESRARRTQVEGFATRLRTMSSGDETAQRALDQALRLLEPAQAAEAAPELEVEVEAGADALAPVAGDGAPAAEVEGPREGDAEPDASEAGHDAATPAVDEQGDVELAADAAGELPEPVAARADRAEPETEPVEAAVAEPEPGPAREPEPVEPEPEPEPIQEPVGLGIALGAAAEAALFAGDLTAAHDGLLAAARAHRRAGRLSAAVDACYLAIGLAPSDPDLHLLLTELYLDRGWRGQAVEKLLLLGRLADLDDDAAVRERLCTLVSARLADEPRVAELCA
jgi:tetratricopeptide (TPR) repeat protein